MRKLRISRGKRRTHPYIQSGKTEWAQLARKLLDFKRTGETFAEYMAMPPDRQADIKDVGYLVGGPFEGTTRRKDKLLHRSLITLDVDHCDDPQELLDSYAGYELVMHSTHKHQDSAPRLRIVFPLSRDVSPDEYEAVARNLADHHGMDDFDDTTFEVSRIMYWPSASSDGDVVATHQEGHWVNPDDWDPAQDWMDWPRSSRIKQLRKPVKEAKDPLTAPGIIGAFNRVHDIHSAIALYLGDVFEPTEFDNRYRPYGATGPAGAIVYDDVFMYSHHENPAEVSQRNVNAFDLVRLCLFGESQDDDDEPMMQRASFVAMTQLALKEDAVAAEIERPDIDDELPEDEPAVQRANIDAYADALQNAHFDTITQALAELRVVATYTPAEADIALAILKEKTGIGMVQLREDVKRIRKQLAGRTEEGELADIERELVDEVLAEHFAGGAHIRRAGRVYWEYRHGVWMMIDDEVIEGRLQKTIVRLREERPEDVEQLTAAIGEAKTSSLVGALSRMLKGRLADETARDDDPLHLRDRITRPVVNCLNGEVYVMDDGSVELRPHNPDHFYTLQVACDYDPKATCPEFDRFMAMVFDDERWLDPEDMVRHLEELGGYVVNMSRWLKSWVLFHGPTDTGKSTVLSIFKEMLGNACLAMELGRFGIGNTFADSSLVGKLLLADDDFDKSASLPDGFIKKISEEKMITSDIKFGAPLTFVARCLPLVCANHWPVTRDVSDAFRERALVFEFVHRIVGEEKSDRRRDLMLLELPGILNRFIAGLARLRERGTWDVPIDCAGSHMQWVGQSNQAYMFIDDRIERDGEERVKRADVWRDYKSWHRDQGGVQLGQREFFQRMAELLGEPRMYHGSPVYIGVRLRPPEGLSRSDDEL